MKWTYTIKNKLLASVVLLVLCLLVFLSNYLDRLHTRNVKNSISTLYEDRLIAEVYILKMTSAIYQIKEVLNAEINTVFKNTAISKLSIELNDTFKAFSKTKLTTTEKETATELINHIKNLEKTILNNNYSPTNYTEKALFSLNKLSTIQIEESKLIMQNVESEYANIKASSQFAFAIIIIILLVLQALVFSAKTIVPVTKPKNPTLN
ncbi:MAG: MCP four helix bundle domain-containing protein [Bacteroidia bacterium]|jgi:hypothetical protein|nr:MCP four helix bundle domain-containing protein [Bacteroidota bacterium]MBP6511708.1 MCP four helix bundle domain-containing protein [Bacteroidia bacterium]MBP7244790.1 MCP four helix bundle domain-containing protein [Bacteroidia bacterium]